MKLIDFQLSHKRQREVIVWQPVIIYVYKARPDSSFKVA